MKPLLFALCVVLAFGGLSAQTPAWQPLPGHTQVPIWLGAVPDAQPVADPESETKTETDPLVARRPWVEHFSPPALPGSRPPQESTWAAWFDRPMAVLRHL
jgi:hypothetical protein